ncbi:hypothetical protein KC640_03685, partial [Candidatus Dojkabacteria bacterium]|nr:hypothetical protein [Candidatus Dojkabacteria bacterium]
MQKKKVLRKYKPIPLTPERINYVLIQLFVGTLILVITQALYFNHVYFAGFISPVAAIWMRSIFWFVMFIVWVDPLIKLFFVKKLPITNFTLIFVYFVQFFINLRSYITGEADKFNWRSDSSTKTAFLAILVKFFYFPIMLNTIANNSSFVIGQISGLQQGIILANFDSIYGVLVSTIFLVDTSIFAFGYTFEAVWLRNKIRSVEPTLLGWVVALATYPPFNGLTSQFLPMYANGSTAVAQNELGLRIAQILILLCNLIFVSASIALFTKGSNLTNRGIVARGPYRFVRHPAYVVKLIGFFLEGVLYASSVSYFFGWAGFASIYYMRAWTEERHLSRDPDYVAYKKKVKWRFVPG